MITVMKFGGTSVGSVEAIERVANIIKNTEGDRVVVASAMSGITNYLIGVMERENNDIDQLVAEFAAKHMAAAEQMFDGELMEEFKADFETRLVSFRAAFESDSADPYYKDKVISQGERLSTLMLSYYLKKIGVRSEALTSEMAGIVAVGLPQAGSADLVATANGMTMKVKPLLTRGIVPIITGYYGVTETGKPLTFGRGGSDYSAAVVANAIDADMLEIWTDVDGFMTSDPRMVKGAVKIDEMNFGEAAELAYFGAKVLHPRTIEPVRLKHIPLKVRNSFKPQEPGTLIHHLRKSKGELLRSVASKTDLSIITVNVPELAYRPDVSAKIIKTVAEADVIIYCISTSLSTLAVAIEAKDAPPVLKALNGLSDEGIERIDVKNDMALVCCVGDEILGKCGVSAAVFGAVADAGANVELISEGASQLALNFIVPMGKVVDVVISLHDKFLGGKQ